MSKIRSKIRTYDVCTDAMATTVRASSAERAIEIIIREERITPREFRDGAWVIATAQDGTDSAERRED